MSIKSRLIETQYELQYQLQRLTQPWRFRHLAPPGGEWPILMEISFPKSGTNLLRQVLPAFMKLAPFADRSYRVFATFDAVTGKQRGPQEAFRYLDSLRAGDIASAHFLAWSEVIARVCTQRYIPYFIYRDPRDVVVSHVFYVTKMAPEHIHHKYYAEELHTFEDRLCASILGRPEASVVFPDIGKRVEPYMGWLDHPEVLPLRFEDFILDRRATLERVLDHFLKSLPVPLEREPMLDWMEQCINPQRSPTFRSGKVGEWKKSFNEEHKRLFKEVSGDLLIRLGYEKDYDW